MDKTNVPALMEAWLDYIELDDRASAAVDVADIREGLALHGDRLVLAERNFQSLVKWFATSSTDNTLISLAFPLILHGDNG